MAETMPPAVRKLSATWLLITLGCLVPPFLSGKALFHEDFATTPPGSFPSELVYFGETDVKGAPLLEAFKAYHIEATIDAIAQAAKEVRAAAANAGHGKAFTLSGNLATATRGNPRWIELARTLDYLNKELHFSKNDSFTPEVIEFYTVMAGIGRQAIAMPEARNNAAWRRQEDPKFYQFLVAQAYAMGHLFHAPFNLYDGSTQTRFFGKFEHYRPVFDFINKHQQLLDDYWPIASTALVVVYDPLHYDWTLDAKLAARMQALRETNQPFRVLFTGKGLPPLDLPYLEKLDKVELFGDIRRLPKQEQTALQKLATRRVPPPPFTFTGPDSIRVFARGKDEPSTQPLVFHLLAPPTLKLPDASMQLMLKPELLPGANVTGAVFYTPDGQARKVAARTASDGVRFRLPSFAYWGLLQITTAEPSRCPFVCTDKEPPALRRSTIPIMRLKHSGNPEAFEPPWLQKQQAEGVGPLEAYHATLISWSYRKSSSLIESLQARNVRFTGSVSVGARIPDEAHDLDWIGYARDAKGEPLKFRSDFRRPPFLGNLSSEVYISDMVKRSLDWVELGANGIQWDDVEAYIIRAYERFGGDYSEGALKAFGHFLQQNYANEELAAMGLEEISPDKLKSALEEAVPASIPVRVFATEGTHVLLFPYEASDRAHPLRRVATPPLSAENNIVYADVRFRLLPGKGGSRLGFYLYDGELTVFGATAFAQENALKVFTEGRSINTGKSFRGAGKWNSLQIRLHYGTKEMTFSINGGDESRPYPFRNPGAVERDSFALVLVSQPDANDTEVASITIREGAVYP